MTGTATATATPATASDVDAVRAGFNAVAAGDLAGFAALFHPDATWNHRNDDRLGGLKEGVEAIVGFLGESMELTTGTLRPVPEIFMPDGDGRVTPQGLPGRLHPSGMAAHPLWRAGWRCVVRILPGGASRRAPRRR